MTGGLGAGDRSRIGSAGVGTLSSEDGLGLLDLALARDEALLAPIRLSIPALRAVARAGRLPACLRGLAPVPRAVQGVRTRFAGPALIERLAKAGESERLRLLTDLVREETAGMLGHDTPEGIAPDVTFLEQGVDSLTAVELRNRLNTITGLRLTGAMAFDHPTPAILGAHLREKLGAAGALDAANGTAPPRDARRYVAGGRDPASGTPGADSLSRLYLAASREGRAEEMMGLVRGLAAFRPTFTDVAGLAEIPAAAPVSRGPEQPALICFPSFAGTADAQEFARFAAGFRGHREVSVIPTPGFVSGEPLAADVEALLAAHIETIRKSANGAPYVVVGYSSGGLVAHAIATRLEGSDITPAGLVLIDTFSPEVDGVPAELLAALPGAVLANNEEQQNVGSDDWFTAVAHYYSMDWRGLPATEIPTLLIRAGESVGEPVAVPKKSSWNLSSPHCRGRAGRPLHDDDRPDRHHRAGRQRMARPRTRRGFADGN